jgi:hypothetical protein
MFVVELSDRNVTDADLALFRNLPLVEMLFLDNTKITDAGLEHLKGLSKLEILSIINTNVSPKGIATLQVALPSLAIKTKKEKPQGINPFTAQPYPD